MIKPTVGRVMWYWPNAKDRGDQPLCALVTRVCSDHKVNLVVFSSDGTPSGATEVPIVQEGSGYSVGDSPYAEWMPYQTKVHAERVAAGKET
jgi:hypothetical protein